MATNNELRQTLYLALEYFEGLNDTKHGKMIGELLQHVPPDRPKLTYRQFYVSVLEGFDRTDQDQGGTWSAADFIDHVGHLLDIGVDVSPYDDVDFSEDEDSEMGAKEDEDQPVMHPCKWVEKDIVPPHNAS